MGEPARKAIRGNNLDFYLDLLHESREKTLAEFRKRDDNWLMTVDKEWPWDDKQLLQMFHVCEHESNHNGQIKLLFKAGCRVQNQGIGRAAYVIYPLITIICTNSFAALPKTRRPAPRPAHNKAGIRFVARFHYKVAE